MYNIILLGPPGSGKGTQSNRIIEATQALHVATGDIIRWNIRHKTELGLKSLSYNEKGILVPDDLVLKMIKLFLNQSGDTNIVWDGYPRTYNQALALDKLLVSRNNKIDYCFLLDIDLKKLLQRIVGRLTCNNCGRTYHAIKLPPKVKNICDYCGARLSSRGDDTSAKYEIRLITYKKWADKLAAYYRAQNKLIIVDANQAITDITDQILATIND